MLLHVNCLCQQLLCTQFCGKNEENKNCFSLVYKGHTRAHLQVVLGAGDLLFKARRTWVADGHLWSRNPPGASAGRVHLPGGVSDSAMSEFRLLKGWKLDIGMIVDLSFPHIAHVNSSNGDYWSKVSCASWNHLYRKCEVFLSWKLTEIPNWCWERGENKIVS